jgi:hypothetical protein
VFLKRFAKDWGYGGMGIGEGRFLPKIAVQQMMDGKLTRSGVII